MDTLYTFGDNSTHYKLKENPEASKPNLHRPARTGKPWPPMEGTLLASLVLTMQARGGVLRKRVHVR